MLDLYISIWVQETLRYRNAELISKYKRQLCSLGGRNPLKGILLKILVTFKKVYWRWFYFFERNVQIYWPWHPPESFIPSWRLRIWFLNFPPSSYIYFGISFFMRVIIALVTAIYLNMKSKIVNVLGTVSDLTQFSPVKILCEKREKFFKKCIVTSKVYIPAVNFTYNCKKKNPQIPGNKFLEGSYS